MKTVSHLSCKNTIEAENSPQKQGEQTTGNDNVVENDNIDFKDAGGPDFIPGPRIVQQQFEMHPRSHVF